MREYNVLAAAGAVFMLATTSLAQTPPNVPSQCSGLSGADLDTCRKNLTVPPIPPRGNIDMGSRGSVPSTLKPDALPPPAAGGAPTPLNPHAPNPSTPIAPNSGISK